MRYNRYLYRLPVQAVPITDIVKNSISSADIVTDPIIGTSLPPTQTLAPHYVTKCADDCSAISLLCCWLSSYGICSCTVYIYSYNHACLFNIAKYIVSY